MGIGASARVEQAPVKSVAELVSLSLAPAMLGSAPQLHRQLRLTADERRALYTSWSQLGQLVDGERARPLVVRRCFETIFERSASIAATFADTPTGGGGAAQTAERHVAPFVTFMDRLVALVGNRGVGWQGTAAADPVAVLLIRRLGSKHAQIKGASFEQDYFKVFVEVISEHIAEAGGYSAETADAVRKVWKSFLEQISHEMRDSIYRSQVRKIKLSNTLANHEPQKDSVVSLPKK